MQQGQILLADGINTSDKVRLQFDTMNEEGDLARVVGTDGIELWFDPAFLTPEPPIMWPLAQ